MEDIQQSKEVKIEVTEERLKLIKEDCEIEVALIDVFKQMMEDDLVDPIEEASFVTNVLDFLIYPAMIIPALIAWVITLYLGVPTWVFMYFAVIFSMTYLITHNKIKRWSNLH